MNELIKNEEIIKKAKTIDFYIKLLNDCFAPVVFINKKEYGIFYVNHLYCPLKNVSDEFYMTITPDEKEYDLKYKFEHALKSIENFKTQYCADAPNDRKVVEETDVISLIFRILIVVAIILLFAGWCSYVFS